MNSLMKERLKNCQTLPSPPGVALEILDLCRKEIPDIQRIATVIGQDPALASHVLRVVNSPFYGLRNEVDTISHAMMLLGANSVRTLALSFSLIQGLRRDETAAMELPNYWQRCLISAIACRALGGWLQMPNEEGLFLVGLLQDVGMLALRESYGELYTGLVTQADGSHEQLLELERAEFGCDHGEVSGWLAQEWNLPEIYQSCLRFSHELEHPQAPVDLLCFIKLVALSGMVAGIWVGKDSFTAAERTKTAAQELAGVSEQDFLQVLSRIAEAQGEVARVFKINLGEPGIDLKLPAAPVS